MPRRRINDDNRDNVTKFMEITNKRGNISNNKVSKEYMSDPNVKEFNKAVREHCVKKTFHPNMAFQSVETLQKDLEEFFDLCDRTNTVPTIVAIALYLGVNRDTIYAHANNPNSPVSDVFKNVISYCHMSMENGALVGKINPVTYIFLGKNYFGLRDDKNITVTPTSDNAQISSKSTMDAIQKQLEEETIPNADYQVK
jgi:hypothetical protein